MFFVAKIQGGFFCAKMRRRLYIFIATNCNEERSLPCKKRMLCLAKRHAQNGFWAKGKSLLHQLANLWGNASWWQWENKLTLLFWNGFGAFDGSGKGKSIGKKQKARLVVGELNGRRDWNCCTAVGWVERRVYWKGNKKQGWCLGKVAPLPDGVGGWRGKASDGWNAILVERQVVEKQVAKSDKVFVADLRWDGWRHEKSRRISTCFCVIFSWNYLVIMLAFGAVSQTLM